MADFDAVMWDFGGVFSESPFSALDSMARERDIEPALDRGPEPIFAFVAFRAGSLNRRHRRPSSI